MSELAAGLLVIAAALAAARVSEAMDLLRFPLAWSGVLLVLDALARLRHGRSPLATVRDWLACAGLSIAFWDLFELLNLRLHNWWYTGLSQSPLLGSLFAAISFATVLPAIRLGLAAATPREEPPLRAASDELPRRPAGPVRRNDRALLLLAGALALALPLAWPRVFFGLAWLFLWPLCEAALTRLPRDPAGSLPSPLESLRARDRRLPLRLLALALPLGLLWESLNWGCERGWFYTVPHFERFKLFEMPLPGYLGYLPFLLEAGAALALLERVRLRPWHLAAVLAFHLAADGIARPRTGLSTAPMHSALARTGFMGDAWAARLQALGIADRRALAAADWRDLQQRLGTPDPAIVRAWIDKSR